MKVLHVTDADLPARRFNGYDLLDDLAGRGISGKQAVLRKSSHNDDVVSLFAGPGDEDLQAKLLEVERRHSINNLLFPWGRLLARTREFEEADVVHYHLVHNQVISLYDLKTLFALKPSVWTFHDPWPLTGHCVHPMGCEGWRSGCAPCPFLDRLFPLASDHADQMWRIKKRLFSEVDVDVVVASDWMLDLVHRSPITSHLENVHLIPFGIDTRLFAPKAADARNRRELGIPEGDFVVLFRASSWDVKGLSFIIEALARQRPARPTTLLTLGEHGLVRALARDYRIRELGWVDDETRYAQILGACDVFLTPSLAESFGLMAVEAMAAGRPVVCFEGTALPSVTHAPKCGVAVPARDAVALRAALDELATDPVDRERRGSLGRKIVADHYGFDRYLDAMAGLYSLVLSRHRSVAAADGDQIGPVAMPG